MYGPELGGITKMETVLSITKYHDIVIIYLLYTL